MYMTINQRNSLGYRSCTFYRATLCGMWWKRSSQEFVIQLYLFLHHVYI